MLMFVAFLSLLLVKYFLFFDDLVEESKKLKLKLKVCKRRKK